MKYFHKGAAAVLLMASLTACNSSNDSNQGNVDIVEVEPQPTLDLPISESPIALGDLQAQYSKDIAYGDDERNQFDIYLPTSDTPTPLVIYIHGGAFTGGSKESLYGQEDRVRDLIGRGFAVATINYYLLTVTPPDTNGVIRSLNDSKRALQFMRYQAANLNIDPEKIAIYGGSAGAGTAIWLGTHDDMAEPDSEDPVLRESTRLSAVGALATQSTYDIIRWEDVLIEATSPLAGILGGTDFVTIANAVGQTDLLLAFLGISSVDQIESAETVAYRQNLDMLELMDATDAPLFVNNTTPSINNVVDYMFHHGLHGRALKEQADAVGLENITYVTDPNWVIEHPSGEQLEEFFARQFQ